MWVKICGNTNLEDAEVAVEAGADALGFVFASSPRRVTAAQAGAILAGLRAPVEGCGVFVDAGFDEIADTVEEAGLTGVQLHTCADPALPGRLRARWSEMRILRVAHFGSDAGVEALDVQLARFGSDPAVDAVLVDSRTAEAPGGTGVRYDWSEAANAFASGLQSGLRLIAAGGLSPANVAEAIGTMRPWGVDVVSGVEAVPGQKDAGKVRDFIRNARSAVI